MNTHGVYTVADTLRFIRDHGLSFDEVESNNF